jgi:hypothetical protein
LREKLFRDRRSGLESVKSFRSLSELCICTRITLGGAAEGLPEALEARRVILPFTEIDWPNDPNVPEYELRLAA